MATLAELVDEVQAGLDRPLTEQERLFVNRMYRYGKKADYCLEVLAEPEPAEPADEELMTTKYEATISGPQDITGIWG